MKEITKLEKIKEMRAEEEELREIKEKLKEEKLEK